MVNHSYVIFYYICIKVVSCSKMQDEENTQSIYSSFHLDCKTFLYYISHNSNSMFIVFSAILIGSLAKLNRLLHFDKNPCVCIFVAVFDTCLISQCSDSVNNNELYIILRT